jgi:hypothetical protein
MYLLLMLVLFLLDPGEATSEDILAVGGAVLVLPPHREKEVTAPWRPG